jgi:hypothetical protein
MIGTTITNTYDRPELSFPSSTIYRMSGGRIRGREGKAKRVSKIRK